MTTEQLEANLNRIHEWIRAADQKASIFLALVLGTLALGGKDFSGFVISRFSSESVLLILALAISNVVLVWSIFKALMIIKPSVANNAKSFTYFGRIAQVSLKDYRKTISRVNTEKYKDELVEQIHTSSKIARGKHRQLAEAVKLFCIYFVILAALIGLTYVT